MGKIVLKDARVLIGPYDRSGDHNTVELNPSREMLENTTFASAGGWQEFQPGLHKVTARGSGFWLAGVEAGATPKAVDTHLFNALDLDEENIISVLAKFLAGERCYSFRSILGAYTPGPGQHGQLARFSFEAQGRGDVFAGGIALQAGIVNATGNSAPIQVGAVSATQKLYAVIHTYSFAGTNPTLDVRVQSDTVGFPSPTDRITFSQKTGFAAEWAVAIPGPITDDYWRIAATLGGTVGPQFGVLVAMAIQ